MFPWEECCCTIGLSRGRIKNPGEVAPAAAGSFDSHTPHRQTQTLAPRCPTTAQTTRTGPHTGARENTVGMRLRAPNAQRLRNGNPMEPAEARATDQHPRCRWAHGCAHSPEVGKTQGRDGCTRRTDAAYCTVTGREVHPRPGNKETKDELHQNTKESKGTPVACLPVQEDASNSSILGTHPPEIPGPRPSSPVKLPGDSLKGFPYYSVIQ